MAQHTKTTSDRKRVTLSDVAQATGLAKSTVSMVLNGSWKKVGIKPERVEQIRKIAEELGYRTNYAAHCMVTGKYSTIAMVCGKRHFTSSVSPALVGGICLALGEHNYHMSIEFCDDDKLTDPSYLPSFLETHHCDGILLNYHAGVPLRLIELIQKSRLPAVWLNYKMDHNCVHPNDYQAGFDLTRYLLELGHRHILYVDHSFYAAARRGTRHYSKEDRMDGYRDCMLSAGLQPHLFTDTANEEDFDSLFQRLRSLLRQPVAERPTAIMTYAQELLAYIRLLAAEEGLAVPRQLSLATFGGHRDALVLFHGFTVSRVPTRKMGAIGAEMVLELIANPTTLLPPRTVDFEIFPRQSTAEPPTE